MENINILQIKISRYQTVAIGEDGEPQVINGIALKWDIGGEEYGTAINIPEATAREDMFQKALKKLNNHDLTSFFFDLKNNF